MYQRPTYVLMHGETFLLALDVEITPPFALGEVIRPFDAYTGVELGVYRVVGISRRLPYRIDPTDTSIRIALAGAEIAVQLEVCGCSYD